MCCTWLGVPELGKDAGVPCVHLTPRGCGIYVDRPHECREFTCAWLVGVGDPSVRPDRLGGVVTAAPEKQLIVIFGPDLELERKSAYVRRLVAKQVRRGHGVAFVRGAEPRRLLASPEDLERIMGQATHEGDT